MKRIFTLFALITVFSIAAAADVRLPNTPKPTPTEEKKSIETDLRIRLRKDAKEARLLIPKDRINELRAQLDELDGGSNTAAFLSVSRAQTVIGGLFLSLAMVFGGVWLTRARTGGFKPHKAIVAGAGLLFVGAFAVASFANMGPPPEARSITGKIFTPGVHMYKQASGKIRVEASDNDWIELIVPDVADEKKTGEE
jgi:hypothetical protein